jgi:response regulator RpfG family c-di-GMP phosphodiesterase
MVLKNDPEMGQQVQNTQLGGASLAALDAHIREHLGFLFRSQIEEELGIELPPMGEPLPRDIEKRLSVLIAQAADQLLGKKQQQAEQQRIAEQQQDPIIQQRQQELEIRAADVQRKAQADQQKAMLDQQKLAASIESDENKTELEAQRIRLEAARLAAELGLERQKVEINLMKD